MLSFLVAANSRHTHTHTHGQDEQHRFACLHAAAAHLAALPCCINVDGIQRHQDVVLVGAVCAGAICRLGR